MVNLWKEEMNFYGVTDLGVILSKEEIDNFIAHLIEEKRKDILKYGEEYLVNLGDYETVRDLIRFGGKYFDLLENQTINDFINCVLNDKAVLSSMNAIILQEGGVRSKMVGYKFHRDQPYFRDTRTSAFVMIPLVDYSSENGSTEYIPGSHLFEEMPSQKFLEKHKVSTRGVAGQAIGIDAAVWHRAGINSSGQPRPMIVMRYHLAPFKQQIDFCGSREHPLEEASDLVKQRLGWNVRVCKNYEEYRVPGDRRKFKSGQYDMSNTSIR